MKKVVTGLLAGLLTLTAFSCSNDFYEYGKKDKPTYPVARLNGDPKYVRGTCTLYDGSTYDYQYAIAVNGDSYTWDLSLRDSRGLSTGWDDRAKAEFNEFWEFL